MKLSHILVIVVERLATVQHLMVLLPIVKVGYPTVVGVRVGEHVTPKEPAVIMETE